MAYLERHLLPAVGRTFKLLHQVVSRQLDEVQHALHLATGEDGAEGGPHVLPLLPSQACQLLPPKLVILSTILGLGVLAFVLYKLANNKLGIYFFDKHIVLKNGETCFRQKHEFRTHLSHFSISRLV